MHTCMHCSWPDVLFGRIEDPDTGEGTFGVALLFDFGDRYVLTADEARTLSIRLADAANHLDSQQIRLAVTS